MGEAKRRGSLDQRVAMAVSRKESEVVQPFTKAAHIGESKQHHISPYIPLLAMSFLTGATYFPYLNRRIKE